MIAKRNTLYIILLIFFLLVIFFWNRTEHLPFKIYYKANTALNVRSGPGTNNPILFTLNKNDEFVVLDKEKDWYKIQYDTVFGYAYAKHFSISRIKWPEVSIQTNSIPSFINAFLIVAYILLFVIIVKLFYNNLRSKKSVTYIPSHNRGTASEKDLVAQLIKSGIPAHQIFHDLLIEKFKGAFAQVDVVAITDVGLLVFEVKEYSGWLYGRGNEQSWIKELDQGKTKYRFYNPILQNKKHIAEIKKLHIEFYQIPVFSIIIFYGTCSLKDIQFVPKDTFVAKADKLNAVLSRIYTENKKIKYNRLNSLIHELQKAVNNGAIAEKQQKHNANIKDMLGEDRVFD